MGLKMSDAKSSSDRPQVPEGNHVGICVRIYDLGTQEDEYEGKLKLNRKVRLGFELPDEKAVFSEDKGEQPFLIDMTLNFSSFERSNFVKTMTAWNGKAPDDSFDLEEQLGKAAMVNIAHREVKGKTYANITSLTPVPKALLKSIPDPENKPVYWSVENGRDAAFEKLPDFLKEIIEKSREFNTESPDDAAANQKGSEEDPDWQ